MTKLVARETKNRQLFAILLRQGIQLNEVPDGSSSHSSDIIYEHDFSFELSKVEICTNLGIVPGASSKGFALEIMEGGGHSSNSDSTRLCDLNRRENSQGKSDSEPLYL